MPCNKCTNEGRWGQKEGEVMKSQTFNRKKCLGIIMMSTILLIPETLKIERNHHTLSASSCGLGCTCSQGLTIIVFCVGDYEGNCPLAFIDSMWFFAAYGLCLCLWELYRWVLPASLNTRFLTDMIKLGHRFCWDFTNLKVMRLGVYLLLIGLV